MTPPGRPRRGGDPAGVLLALKDISKTYWLGSTPVRALRHVSLSIRQGEFVAIMGPSGSGKTTLLHLLGLLDVPDEGSYRLAGEEVADLSEDDLAALRGQAIGFVFQQFNLLPRLSALENIELPQIYSHGQYQTRPADLVRALGLADRVRHRPTELSGGQQQRVAIARALLNAPRLILADEPTGNLDSATQREIMGLLRKLNRNGLTIVLVTHEADVARYARRTIWMRDGAIVSDTGDTGPLARPATGRLPAAAALAASGSRRIVHRAGAHLSEAARSLMANKARAALSTLGITIGVGAVIAMLALGAGAKKDIKERLSRFGTNMISVSPGRPSGGPRRGTYRRFTEPDAAALKRAHYAIKRTAPVQWTRVAITANGKDANTTAVASTPAYADMRLYRPASGRFFTDRENLERARVCLLGRTVMENLFGEDGRPVGETVKINRIPFTVIGVLPEKGGGGWQDEDDRVIIPLGTSQYRISGDKYIHSVDVEVLADSDVAEVIRCMENFLKRRYRLPDDARDSFRIRNEVAYREALSEMTRTMSLLLGIIAGISLVVGGIGIMNIMLVTVTERTREIGLRKAVGARNRDILLQFLVEAATISITGGLLGIAVGAASAVALAAWANWATTVTAASVALAFGFSAAVGVVFGFWPARRAAQLHPAEALRYE